MPRSVEDNKERIAEALSRDLGKHAYEAFMAEIYWMTGDILHIVNNMDKWLKDEAASDIPFMWKSVNPKIRKDPMGTVLIIGPSNYPFQLTMLPLFGAIAAGNTVAIKPSEITPNSSRIIQEIIESTLDPSCYAVVQGGAEETQALLAEKWDKIFFTGSAAVGRIVAKAAAVHLTPVVLELGGLNPAIVTRNANPRLVARRLLWAKSMNAGQTCTAHNYILIEKSILPAVLEEFKKAYKDFYPNGSRDSPDYGRIVTDKAFQRLKGMLDNSQGKIIFGGTLNEKERYIEQTLVQVDSLEDSMIVNEAFGPICAVYPVNDVDEAIQIANKVHDTPLGISVFGSSSDHEKGEQSRPLSDISCLLTRISARRNPLWKCFAQRCPTARQHPGVRRRGRKRHGPVSRPRQRRRLPAPSPVHQDTQLGREPARSPIPAIHANQIQVAPAGPRRGHAGFRPRRPQEPVDVAATPLRRIAKTGCEQSNGGGNW